MTSLERDLGKNKGIGVGSSMKVDTWPWPCPTSEKGIGSDEHGGSPQDSRRQTYRAINFRRASLKWLGADFTLLLSYDMFAYGKAGSFFKRWSYALRVHMLVGYLNVPGGPQKDSEPLMVFRPSWAERSICAWVVPRQAPIPPSQKEKPPLLLSHGQNLIFSETTQLEHNGHHWARMVWLKMLLVPLEMEGSQLRRTPVKFG